MIYLCVVQHVECFTICRQRRRRSPSSQCLYFILMSPLFYRHTALEHHFLCCHCDDPSFIVCTKAILFRFAKIQMQREQHEKKNIRLQRKRLHDMGVYSKRDEVDEADNTHTQYVYCCERRAKSYRINGKEIGQNVATGGLLVLTWDIHHAIKFALVDKLTDVRTKRTNREITLSHTNTHIHMRHDSASALNKLDRQCLGRRRFY